MGSPVERLTWTVPEAAAVVGVAPMMMRQMIERGDVPSLRIGRRILVSRRVLDEWIVANANSQFAGMKSSRPHPSGPAA